MRTFTNFYRGTVDFRHMGVQVSRICTNFYGAECFEDLLLDLAKKHNTQHSGFTLTTTTARRGGQSWLFFRYVVTPSPSLVAGPSLQRRSSHLALRSRRDANLFWARWAGQQELAGSSSPSLSFDRASSMSRRKRSCTCGSSDLKTSMLCTLR